MFIRKNVKIYLNLNENLFSPYHIPPPPLLSNEGYDTLSVVKASEGAKYEVLPGRSH